MKKLIFIVSLLFSNLLFADTIDFTPYFKSKAGCFILYDTNKNKIIDEYNPSHCKEQVPADSTFKVALSLMAFDQNLINQNTVFKWDGQDKGLAVWNQDQTPHTWLANSAVWVSQQLTPKLGIDKIKDYLQKFNYGNQDFSGGLTEAWLNSSLKISAEEQLVFLHNLLRGNLPISQQAMRNTLANMYLETSPFGWQLYGKSGSSAGSKMYAGQLPESRDGWFVGYVKKDQQTYIFVLNFSDLNKPDSQQMAGIQAKNMVKDILVKQGLF